MSRGDPRAPRWTTPDDVRAMLRKRWDSGVFLAMLARQAPWEPLAVPLRAPTAAELADHFGAARDWTGKWRAIDNNLLRLDYKTVGGRRIGSNRLPCRVWIDLPQQLWTLLGVCAEAETFIRLLDVTRAATPTLVDWMATHPTKVLTHKSRWVSILDTVRWIEHHATRDMYLRQIDVPGVDTKFIEQHRGLLADLLDRYLPADRVDSTHPATNFPQRYGFRSKPTYVRIRALDQAAPVLTPYTELALRVAELAATPLNARTVYVVENEVTYLAFPPADSAVVVFGEGYALPRLQPVQWLHDRKLVYWGDIDTHGFTILDRLRQAFPHTTSMLMDRATLLAHRDHWVREPAPTRTPLQRLRPDEADLYDDLVADTLGPAIRLEQERVRYSAIQKAIGP